jgi:Cd2+/Zn2+-exporting ATPase
MTKKNLIELSRRMMSTAKWNIGFGVIFNTVAVLASGGGLSPIMGAIFHNVGSVMVVISSASIVFASE